MGFEPGNQLHARRKTIPGNRARRLLTQQLIAELNEPVDPKDPEGIKKLRGIVIALIAEGLKGDVSAIKEIFDRTEGKVAQTILGDPENPIEMLHTLRREIIDPNLGDIEERTRKLIEGELANDVTPVVTKDEPEAVG